ncbi:phosphopantetheine-binding protein [Streptomyces virginiae]|uniref:phosphopantetheine-binding protein n=1 Tax=Streptomyces TaxID=1883 RepID=UPI0004C6962A|nr:phosphopantetheine-binding protein [Streptomyces sp. NRRL S-237]
MSGFSRAEIEEVVLSHLAQYDASGTPDPDEDLFETGRVNSLFAVQLIGFLEGHFRFKVTVADLELKNFSTVNKIVEFVVQKTSASVTS